MHRRQAAKIIGAALASACFAPSFAAEAPTGRWKTAVGLNGFQSGSHKYKKNYPIWEVLDFASRSGFDGVELVSDWPSGAYPAVDDKERVSALRGLYDRYGLRIFSIQFWAADASHPDPAVRRRWLKDFADSATLAQQLGCECIGLWPGGGLEGRTADQVIQTLSKSFHEAGQIAADHGLIACFELEPVFAINRADQYIQILREANHDALKGIYDPSHFDLMNGSTGRPEELLERVGVKNIGYLQFCDTDGTLRDGGTSKHMACGEGHTDCAKGLRLLKKGGFRGWIMIDEWEVPDPYDACLKCKAVIDQVRREA